MKKTIKGLWLIMIFVITFFIVPTAFADENFISIEYYEKTESTETGKGRIPIKNCVFGIIRVSEDLSLEKAQQEELLKSLSGKDLKTIEEEYSKVGKLIELKPTDENGKTRIDVEEKGIYYVFELSKKDGTNEIGKNAVPFFAIVGTGKNYIIYPKHIPSLDLSLPIYAGTSESVLQKGVGHMEGTSLPIGGESTHSILTAHTGLNTARMFTDIDKLKKGDIFLIENIKETLAYKVDSIQVIEPTDFSQLVIVPKEDYVTLLTCTPYMVNSHRLLVRGVRTEYTKKSVDEQSNKNKPFLTENNLIMIATIFFDILILIIYWLIFKKSRKEKSKIDKV